MIDEVYILLLSAVTISALHTLSGPDHYLPFIVLSKTRNWSFGRTIFWTVLCGCGHVMSSVLLGLGGAAIGWSLSKISWLQAVRGGIAGWGLVVFGAVYTAWGLVKTKQNSQHKHLDLYPDGSIYIYEHRHGEAVMQGERHKVTPWVMFLIFLLGPCEPMIPLLYVPAARNSVTAMLTLVVVYLLFTLITMAVMVTLGYYGLFFFKTEKLERYMHALGGLTIILCGVGMVVMGW